jgi:predicted HAD superfamily Cof-like phosphohydrolase
MEKNREDVVREFHEIMGQAVGEKQPTADLLELRYKLLCEEVKEVGEEVAYAMAESHFKEGVPDKVKIRLLKELADVQYVLSGFAVALGLPLEKAFFRVHKSNLSKLGEDGRPIYRDDGKVLKGPNYQPVNLEDLF